MSESITDVLNETRKSIKNNNVTFVQIGANDGISHDIANFFLKESDVGYFVEPILESFINLKNNKKNYKDCKFINKAVLPSILKDNKYMNILSDDAMCEGASFTDVNSARIINKVKVETITVPDFLKELNLIELDYFFCDTESLDNLIIDELLKFIQPKVLVFETASWSIENDTRYKTSNGEYIIIPSTKSIISKLKNMSYNTIDFSQKTDETKSDDIIAYKL